MCNGSVLIFSYIVYTYVELLFNISTNFIPYVVFIFWNLTVVVQLITLFDRIRENNYYKPKNKESLASKANCKCVTSKTNYVYLLLHLKLVLQ